MTYKKNTNDTMLMSVETRAYKSVFFLFIKVQSLFKCCLVLMENYYRELRENSTAHVVGKVNG